MENGYGGAQTEHKARIWRGVRIKGEGSEYKVRGQNKRRGVRIKLRGVRIKGEGSE